MEQKKGRAGRLTWIDPCNIGSERPEKQLSLESKLAGQLDIDGDNCV